MTCIVGLEHNGKVYLGGDAAAVSPNEIQAISESKVFITGKFIIGYTDSFRMGQLLEYNLNVPKQEKEEDLKYLITKFVPAVRECLRDGGFAKNENGVEEGGNFLLGYKGKIYYFGTDFQITRKIDGFDTLGAGESFAMGALTAIDKKDPEKALLKALEVASKCSPFVIPPFTVISKG